MHCVTRALHRPGAMLDETTNTSLRLSQADALIIMPRYSCLLATALAFQTFTHSLAVLAAISGNGFEPIVNLGYASYRGSTDAVSNITQFLGIRYAAPPTGDYPNLFKHRRH